MKVFEYNGPGGGGEQDVGAEPGAGGPAVPQVEREDLVPVHSVT